MIKKIFKKWKIDKKRSFMIGDKITDKKAAIKSNLYFEYAKNNFYKQIIKLEQQSGRCVARNRGINIASGKYCLFTNSKQDTSFSLISQ